MVCVEQWAELRREHFVDQRALVEITDDRGHASDFVSLPRDKLASAEHRSARAAS